MTDGDEAAGLPGREGQTAGSGSDQGGERVGSARPTALLPVRLAWAAATHAIDKASEWSLRWESDPSMMEPTGLYTGPMGGELRRIPLSADFAQSGLEGGDGPGQFGHVGEAPSTFDAVTGATLTAGLVWWLTRSGGLLTMVLMGVPAWRHVDLLPVLGGASRPADEDEFAREDEDGPDPDDQGSAPPSGSPALPLAPSRPLARRSNLGSLRVESEGVTRIADRLH